MTRATMIFGSKNPPQQPPNATPSRKARDADPTRQNSPSALIAPKGQRAVATGRARPPLRSRATRGKNSPQNSAPTGAVQIRRKTLGPARVIIFLIAISAFFLTGCESSAENQANEAVGLYFAGDYGQAQQ